MDPGLEKKLSDRDTLDMTKKTTLRHADFLYLFAVLDMTDDEIENAEGKTGDMKWKDGNVLKAWVRKDGENATRRKIIDALEECELRDAKEILEKEWSLVTEGGEDNQERGQAKKKPLHSEQGPDEDDYMDVEPDGGGLYTSRHVKAANPTPAQLTDENYFMSSRVKGLAYILNNKDFPGNSLKERRGSEVDFSNMQHLFKELEYEIILHENLGSAKIRETIKQFASRFNKPGANYSSAVVVLMSHGNTGVILGTDNKKVYLKNIQAELEGDECPKLQDKPKLFFIQACRGESLTKLPSVECDLACGSTTPLPSSTETLQADLDADDNFAKNIPNNADMYFAYATEEGYVSLRDNVEGSWFIQAITEVFLAHAHKESLDKLMNMVTNRVAKMDRKVWHHGVWNPHTKQTPERVSRMRKTFYFLPKYVN